MSAPDRAREDPEPGPVPLVALAPLTAREDALLQALPRHRHNLSRDAVRASQSARILIATAEVVAAKGYAAATAREIAASAGVSQKTFYELFENKEDAFLAAYAAIDVVIGRMAEAAAAYDDPREMIAAGVRSYLDSLAGEPAAARMLVIEAVGAGPRVLERRIDAFADFVDVLALPLELARAADPTLAPVEPAHLLVLLGGVNELILQHIVREDPSTLPGLAPTITRLLEAVCLPAPRG